MAVCVVIDSSVFQTGRQGATSLCNINDAGDAYLLVPGALKCYWLLYAAKVFTRDGSTEVRKAFQRFYAGNTDMFWNAIVSMQKIRLRSARGFIRRRVDELVRELNIELKSKDLEYLMLAVELASDIKSGCDRVYLVTCDKALYEAGKAVQRKLKCNVVFSVVKPSELRL